jgi:hypothetical protein
VQLQLHPPFVRWSSTSATSTATAIPGFGALFRGFIVVVPAIQLQDFRVVADHRSSMVPRSASSTVFHHACASFSSSAHTEAPFLDIQREAVAKRPTSPVVAVWGLGRSTLLPPRTCFHHELDMLKPLLYINIDFLWFRLLTSAHEARLPLPRVDPLCVGKVWKSVNFIAFKIRQKQHMDVVYNFVIFHTVW